MLIFGAGSFFSTLLTCLLTVIGLFVMFLKVSEDAQLYQFTFGSKINEKAQLMKAGQQIDEFFGRNHTKFVTLNLPCTGGLCNMFYRYFSIYGIGRSLGRLPFIDSRVYCFKKKILPELSYAFPNLQKNLKFKKPSGKRKVTFGMNCCKYDNVTRLKRYQKEEYLYVQGTLLQAFQYFHPYKWEVRYLMQFGDDLKMKVDGHAKRLFDGDPYSHKLCVHTRLGDFKQHFLLESTYSFTNPAIEFVAQHLKKSYSKISLVLLGQDTNFTNGITVPKDIFLNTYRPNPLNRTSDLYFGSTYCDSLLISASGSTFAWWLAYLMAEYKQSNIFYNIETAKRKNFGKNTYDYDSFPKEWQRLQLLNNGTIKFEPRWHWQIKK